LTGKCLNALTDGHPIAICSGELAKYFQTCPLL
jgi:hypothetical protein